MPVIELTRRDTYERTLTFKDKSGAAIDITNYTIWFTIKEKDTDTDESALLRRKIVPASHTNPGQGKSKLTLLPAHTDIEPGKYPCGFQINDGSGKIQSARGEVIVEQDLTHDIT